MKMKFKASNFKSIFFIFLILIIVFGFIIGTAIVLTRDKNVITETNYDDIANELLKKYDYTSAAKVLAEGIQKHPNDTNLYHNLANIYLTKNRTDDALQVLKLGLEKNPSSLTLMMEILDIYYLENDMSNLNLYSKKFWANVNIENVENLVKTTDLSKSAYLYFYSMKDSDFDAAKTNLNKIVIDYPSYIKGEFEREIFIVLALSNYTIPTTAISYLDKIEAGYVDEEVIELRKLFENQEISQNEKLINIARYMANHSLSILAKDITEKFSAENPEYYGGFLIKGIAEYQLNNFQDAINDLTKSFDLNPTPESQIYLAQALEKVGETQKAISTYDKAILMDSNNANLKIYAEMLFRANLYTQSANVYKKMNFASKSKDDFANYMRLNYILFNKVNDYENLYRNSDDILRFWQNADGYTENYYLIKFYNIWSSYQINVLKEENKSNASFYIKVFQDLSNLDKEYPDMAILNYYIGIIYKDMLKFSTTADSIDEISKAYKARLEKVLDLDNTGEFAAKAESLLKQ
ncbi:tetratricopeptide repeat protein [bacterium]|nr:MAG: tetratricopeptide repeat protein [bacterium]